MVCFSLEFKKIGFIVEGKAWCPEREMSGHIVSVVWKEGLSRKWGQVAPQSVPPVADFLK